MIPSSDHNHGGHWDVTLAAAREFIRSEFAKHGCVVGIGEVFGHLDEHFGEAGGVTSDVTAVLNLCVDLWADAHIDQVPGGGIDFCWNEAGDWPQERCQGLLARLRGESDLKEVQ